MRERRLGFARDAARDTLTAAAAQWLLRLREPDVTPEDILAWQGWMRDDARHAEAFRRMEELGDLLRGIPRPPLQTPGELAGDTYDASVSIRAWQHRPRRLTRPALAASVVLATAALALFAYRLTSPGAHSGAMIVATRVGENRLVRLADASTVTLGGDSRIEVRFDERERHIDLKRGEAFFTVARDAARPLKVAAGPALVVAVGTEFNVRRGADRVVVDVMEGRVRVEPRSALVPLSLLQSFRPKLRSVAVSAGEETTVDSMAVEPPAPIVDLAQAISWTSGRLAFRMEPLQRVLEDVNRYAKKRIVIGDPEIADVKVTGTVIGDNVSGWVGSLGSALGVVAIEEPDRIVLRKGR